MADANDFLRMQQQYQSMMAAQSPTAGKPMFGIFTDTRGLIDRKPGFNLDKPMMQIGRGKRQSQFLADLGFGPGFMDGFKKVADAGAVQQCNPAEVYGQASHGLGDASGIQAPSIGPSIHDTSRG